MRHRQRRRVPPPLRQPHPAEELAEVAQLDCPQAIRRFRPDRLRTRISAFPAIFVDGIQSLDPESLRVLPTTDADATAPGVAPPG